MDDMFSLEGRVALVTGAGKGIGQAIAIALANSGATIIAHGHTTHLKETVATIEQVGRPCHSFILDLESPEKVQTACEELLQNHQVDILVNNAGIIRRDVAEEYADSDWADVLNVNLNSLFLLTQSLARPMLHRGRGKIINIASLLSFQGGIRVSAYTASKHAVQGLTKALANEWAPRGVQVNAIAPGYIETDNTAQLRLDAERNRAIEARIPAGRWGKPEDLMGAAVFLASSASDYITGHTLVVDGGWLAR